MAYHRPSDLGDALRILALREPRVLAGGTDIYPALSQQTLAGDTLDITAISELSGIQHGPDGWRIGATTTWSDLAQAHLPPAFAALQQAATQVGAIQVQNSATIAGNLCNASPAADGIPPLLILNAQVELKSQRGTRHVPLHAFLRGLRQVNLASDELLTAVFIPNSALGYSAFEKLGARKYLVISICMVAVRLQVSDRTIRDIAISVGACSPVACRLSELEQILLGQSVGPANKWGEVIKTQVEKHLSPIADIRADAPYRSSAATELILRALDRTQALAKGANAI